MIKVIIANEEWEFPTVHVYELQSRLQDYRDTGPPRILEASAPIYELSRLLTGQPVTEQAVEELHYLGRCLEAFTEYESTCFKVALDTAPIQSISDIVIASRNLERYHILPAMNHEELGRRLVERGLESFPEETLPYLDYARVGADYEQSPPVRVSAGGYVVRDDQPDAYRYNGRTLPNTPDGARVELESPGGKSYYIALPAAGASPDHGTEIGAHPGYVTVHIFFRRYHQNRKRPPLLGMVPTSTGHLSTSGRGCFYTATPTTIPTSSRPANCFCGRRKAATPLPCTTSKRVWFLRKPHAIPLRSIAARLAGGTNPPACPPALRGG